MTSNGESAKNEIDKETIFEFVDINRAGNIETIGEGKSFEAPDAERVNNELDEIKLSNTASFEVTTQLDNGVFITFSLEVEYDNAPGFSVDDLLSDSSFIDELVFMDS
ncbi:hypothetical protein Riv7116_3584 [Rivularia sp. PCC 7116]|uniref:hypothetical protein n=1 Tax=Rivularia sp. PCC 7116 TaxID=373994 RepID=UPI00029F46DF|nr:hypothetical protein [Rivularia sp. PCC 7116]AFY56035.1 hypothetical protein Riv7116_3584 [Rivularia sp. PCC 7116]